MNFLLSVERFCLYGHLVAMAFGLAGLLWVVPHPDILAILPAGPTLFQWSMAGGGVAYILLGGIAVALYGYRILGFKAMLVFAFLSVGVSLSSELLGTTSGFPFGHYSYLDNLGWKIAGLVPFTIPLSWFYMGFSSFIIACNGIRSALNSFASGRLSTVFQSAASVLLGAVLLTSWDFVLDPAMSQTDLPFWYWHEPGAFYGMPYQNFAGWLGTGAVFMMLSLVFWRLLRVKVPSQLSVDVPLTIYTANFLFAAIMSVVVGLYVPVMLGLITGMVPAFLCWRSTTLQQQMA
jgi:putative membrane protein